MRVLPGLLVIAFSLTAQAQVAPPQATPKKDPFEGFGNALDKRPDSYHSARTPKPKTALLLVPTPAPAPAPTPVSTLPTASNGLSFEAKLISNGGASKVKQGGSQITETRESKMLVEVRTRNFSAAPAEARLEWFFVARDVLSKKTYVWDQGQRNLSLSAGAEQTELAESTELVRSTTKRSEIGLVQDAFGQSVGTTIINSARASGARPYGWVVRLWTGGRLVLVRTSSNDLETMGRGLTPVP